MLIAVCGSVCSPLFSPVVLFVCGDRWRTEEHRRWLVPDQHAALNNRRCPETSVSLSALIAARSEASRRPITSVLLLHVSAAGDLRGKPPSAGRFVRTVGGLERYGSTCCSRWADSSSALCIKFSFTSVWDEAEETLYNHTVWREQEKAKQAKYKDQKMSGALLWSHVHINKLYLVQ